MNWWSPTAPFWAVPLASGTFLLLGIFFGFLFNSLTDRRRAKREDKLRRADDIKDVAIRVAQITRQLNGLYRSRFKHSQVVFGGNYSPDDVDRSLAAVSDADAKIVVLVSDLELAHAQLRLVAPEAVHLAAGEILQTASTLELPIRVRQSLDHFDDGIDNFFAVVRRELKIDE